MRPHHLARLRPAAALALAACLILCSLLVLLLTGARAGAARSPTEPGPDPGNSGVRPVGSWPLRGSGAGGAPPVVRGFDPPTNPFGPGHRGVDLGGTVGDLVHTALAGTVTYAGLLAGRGVVVVDHGDSRTTYEPVAASVRVGDVLVRGDPIGRLELAGSHCFPIACLHWGWLRGDVYLDPLGLVGRPAIRLLPLGQAAVLSNPGPGFSGGWRPLVSPVPRFETSTQPR